MYLWGREVGPTESVPVLPVPVLKRHPPSIPLYSAQVSIGASQTLGEAMGPQHQADGHQSRAADVSRGKTWESKSLLLGSDSGPRWKSLPGDFPPGPRLPHCFVPYHTPFRLGLAGNRCAVRLLNGHQDEGQGWREEVVKFPRENNRAGPATGFPEAQPSACIPHPIPLTLLSF